MIVPRDKQLRNILLLVISASLAALLLGQFVIKPSFTQLLLDNTQNRSVKFTEHLEKMLVSEGCFNTSPKNIRDTLQHIPRMLELADSFDISRLKVLDPTGRIIYSTEPDEIGKEHAKHISLEQVNRGHTLSRFVHSAPSRKHGGLAREVVETYVPITDSGTLAGALVVYYNISVLYHSLQNDLLKANALTIGLTVIFLAVILALITFLDRTITDRKQINRQLQHANSSLEDAKEEALEQCNQLDTALENLSALIHEVMTTQRVDIRYANPGLVKCYEQLGCDRTECPCYGIGPSRCWQIAGTFCGGEYQGAFARKYGDCVRCQVFRQAASSPLSVMGELFNNMMHIIEAKQVKLEQTNSALNKALAEIKTLRGIVPICSHCKKIRDDSGYWNKVETYVEKHTDALFSHGVCPDCQRKYYPDIDQEEMGD